MGKETEQFTAQGAADRRAMLTSHWRRMDLGCRAFDILSFLHSVGESVAKGNHFHPFATASHCLSVAAQNSNNRQKKENKFWR
jgi:hypothetical protein